MPVPIRITLTVVLALMSLALWNFRDQISLDTSPILYFGVTVALIGALWMFPEVQKGKKGR